MSDFQITAMTAGQWEMVLYWIAGIIAHLALKCQREKITPRQYIMSYPLLSAASFIVSLALVLHSLAVGDNEVMTYFGTGFVADALINRYKKQIEEDTDGQAGESAAVGKDQ